MTPASHAVPLPGETIYRTKGSIVRGYLAWLEHERLFDTVKLRVGSAAAAMMDEPPLPSTWVDSHLVDELMAQIEAERGLAGVKEAGRYLMTQQVVHKLVPMARTVLSLIGTSPASLYGRWRDLLHSVMDGMEAEWVPTSTDSGVLRVTYPRARGPVPLRIFMASLSGLEEVLRLCGREGTVRDPVVVAPNRAEFVVSWSSAH